MLRKVNVGKVYKVVCYTTKRRSFGLGRSGVGLDCLALEADRRWGLGPSSETDGARKWYDWWTGCGGLGMCDTSAIIRSVVAGP